MSGENGNGKKALATVVTDVKWLERELGEIKGMLVKMDDTLDKRFVVCGQKFNDLEVATAVNKTKLGAIVAGIGAVTGAAGGWLAKVLS